jgi:hypothetical protein
MNPSRCDGLTDEGRGLEEHHRRVKQRCGVERAHVRSADEITNHVLISLRAFIRLQAYRLRATTNGHETKRSTIREAKRAYLAHPLHPFRST